MPLTWEGLEQAQPLDFRMTNVLERLGTSGDRWRNVLARKHVAERALRKISG